MRILVTDGMDKAAMETLRGQGHEIIEQFYEPDQLGAALREFDCAVIRSATKIRAQQIQEAKGSRLKLLIRAGVGVDNIDVEAAQAAGIQVKNAPRASSRAVAAVLHGPHVLLRPEPLHRRTHHAGGQMGEEGLFQGL